LLGGEERLDFPTQSVSVRKHITELMLPDGIDIYRDCILGEGGFGLEVSNTDRWIVSPMRQRTTRIMWLTNVPDPIWISTNPVSSSAPVAMVVFT